MVQGQQCMTCRYYEDTRPAEMLGICKAHPPQQVSEKSMAVFPVVAPTASNCGSFKRIVPQ